jgi:hypothetical protein
VSHARRETDAQTDRALSGGTHDQDREGYQHETLSFALRVIADSWRFVMTGCYDFRFLEGAKSDETIDSIEDGARYRVRTCDPYRVKVMLYH